MKKIKKLMSVILCFLLTLQLFTTAIAMDNEANPTHNINEYVNSVLKEYLVLQDYYSFANIYISNSFNVYDFGNNSTVSDRNVYFIFDNDDVIGMLTVVNNQNDFGSKYSVISNSFLSELYTNQSELAIGYENEYLFAVSNGEYYSFLNNTNLSVSVNSLTVDTQVLKKARAYNAVIPRDTILFDKQLSVNHVSNANNPTTGAGLCWAACVAMKVNYQTYRTAQLNSIGVYQLLKSKYGGNPIGNMTWYKRAYPYFNVSCTYLTRGLGTGEVSDIINLNIPIQIGLSTDDSAHAVLIVGCRIYSNHAIYSINDPNDPEVQYQDVTYNAMSNPDYFVYYANTKTYTSWNKSIY